MDTTQIIYAFTKTWVFLLPLIVLITLIKTPWFKGVFGEFIVNTLARFLLDKNTYHLIKNVTLPTADGTTQLDHIIVSIYGIFVVETKNMKGWIFGSANQKTWTQKLYKRTFKFQNPIQQNYKHIKTLEQALNINEENIFSLIVFIGNSEFKTEMPENVTHGVRYIRYIKSKKIPIFSDSKVKEIIQNIQHGRLTPSVKTNREHIKHVKKIVAEKKCCPKCDSAMVLREASKGVNSGKKFWGCSNFPKCRSTLAF